LNHIVHLLLSLTFISMMRTNPNIVITGTPGVGKTTHAELLARNTGLKHLPINQVAKEHDCHEDWDEELQTWIVDEDKVGWGFKP
jgi:adenylate kinase